MIAAMALLLTAFQATSSAQSAMSIDGSVTVDGVGVAGVGVDLFEQDANGARGDYITSTPTADSGGYFFPVSAAGCFILTFVAPADQSFNGGQYLQVPVCVEDGMTETVDVALDSQLAPDSTVSGAVADTTGAPVPAVSIDVFETAEDGSRGPYLESTTTGADGTYAFGLPFGCYTLTFIAPLDQVFINGTQFFQPSVCTDDENTTATADATIQSEDPSDTSVGGTVTFLTGDAAEGVQIDLFTQDANGGRDEFVGFTATGDDGGYFFDVVAGCYIVTFIAPAGETWVSNGGEFLQAPACVETGVPVTDLDAVLDAVIDYPSSLGGTVTGGNGSPIPGLQVTFFDTQGDGSRGTYLGSEFSDSAGQFSKGVQPGCYWLVYVAPFGESFNDSQYLEQFVCVEDGEDVTDLDAMLDGEDPPPPTTTTTTTIPDDTTTTTVPDDTTTTTTIPDDTTTTTVPDDTTTTTTIPDDTTTTTAAPPEITISVSDVETVELDVDGIRNALVVFTLSAESPVTVVVDFTTVDGTATVADGDYLFRDGTDADGTALRFAPGRTTLTRAIRILGDVEVEGDETLTVALSNPINATIADGEGLITIIDND